MFISRILTDLCTIRQNIEIKNPFADTACNVLAAKKMLVKQINICLKSMVSKVIKWTD